ncbi:zinc import ATP-binding protein ZnuC [Clostridia bacterium]|nr:zinc import ATP-binding protein ZnuC [Clostridia bacterium]
MHCLTTVSGLGVKLGRNELLRGVDFDLHCGQLTALIGRNGAGKTTLLRALLGQTPHTGTVNFTRQDTPGRLTLGYVPQRVPLDANSPTSVHDLFTLSGAIPAFLPPRKARKRQIADMLNVFGAEDLIDRRLCELSGGEWQRVMLAAATNPAPDLLILDEPSAGVDAAGLTPLYENIDKLKRERDMAVLMVSHDFALLSKYADHVLLLDGCIKAAGAPEKVFNSPEFKELFNV